jgi:nucleoside-diphosphate-sugar epimerase
MSKSIILTGGSGFIGSHLISEIISKGYAVICLKRSTSVETYKHAQVSWMNWEDIDNHLISNNNVTAIIHLATAYGRKESIADVEYINVYLPLKLLELCKLSGTTFINTDSFFTKPIHNYNYMMPYILTKQSFLTWGKYYSRSWNTQFINMRLEHVYGAGDRAGKFIPYLIDCFNNKKDIIECTSSIQRRDFIHVKDVISAYSIVLDNLTRINENYVEFQVGTGKSISLRDFIELLQIKMNAKNTKINFGSIEMRHDEIMDSSANVSGLISLGWEQKYNLDDGISDMLNVKHD